MRTLRSVHSALLGLGFMGAALMAATAMAGSTSGTFTVTANVVASCKIGTVNGIAFGNYDPANVNATNPLNGQGSIAVSCTKSTAAAVSLDQGVNAASGSTCAAPSRQMITGANKLAYGIYMDSARSSAWGCSAGANTASFTATSALTANTLTTYGSVPGGQDVPAGAYSDTVTFTVTF